MKRFLAGFVGAAAAAAIFGWAAQAQDTPSVEDRLASVEKRLDAVEAKLAGPAAPPKASSSAPANQGSAATDTVYVTSSGTKYHRQGCTYLRGEGNPLGLDAAKARGLMPCSKCSPPQ